MRILVLALILLTGCLDRGEHDAHLKRQKLRFDNACVERIGALFPGKRIQRGDWVRHHEWRERLYLLDGRVLRCKQEHHSIPTQVSIRSVKFFGKGG